MQKTIRVLRIALPIAFVAFVLIIAVSWRRAIIGKDPAGAVPVKNTLRPTDQPRGEAIAFKDTQTIGGRVVSEIIAERVVPFVSGWTTLEGVRITIYRPTGLTYQITCPTAQFNSLTKEADAKGGVRVTSSDGVEISTAQIRYDGNRLTNDIPVQFKIDEWTGNGGALDIDVEAETIRLFKKVTAATTAQPNVQPMTLEAQDGVFRRRENDVQFTSDVVMTRGADRLTGDRMAGRFTKDRKRLVAMEGNGNVRIEMAANTLPGEDIGGAKTITCDRFYSDVTAEGELSAINAIGEPGLAHAVLAGPPMRDIVARSFRIGLADRAVNEIRADYDVVMKEMADVTREISSDRVRVSFDAARHRATSAYLEGNVKYRDPKTTASAIRANYDIAGDLIVLTAQPGFDPSVTSDGQTVKARQISLAPRGGTFTATGHVIAQLVSKQGGPSADATNVFPASSPVFVNADQLVMKQSNKTAVFSGNVKAWQVTNTMFAQELQVQGVGQVITARGNVRTILYNAEGSDARKTPVTSRSEQLIGRRNERRIELLGGVNIEDESRVVTGEQASLFFDGNRKIERIEAEKNVVLVEKSTNRKATGDKAVYHIARKMAYLTGSPATATDPGGTLKGQQIAFDLNRNRVQVVSPTGETSGTYKQQ